MKKILCVLIMVCMLSSSVAPAFASDAESEAMQRVLIEVKERIGSTDEYDEFYSNVSSRGSYETYNFSWTNQNKNLSISANSDGVITSYNYYENTNSDYGYAPKKPSINKMTSSEAIEKVKPLIAKLNPDISDNIRIISDNRFESLWNNSFSFNLQRTENGVDVIGDTGYVTVDSKAEVIENFRINYTPNLEFEFVGSAIDVSQAKEAYKSNIGLKLQYVCESEKAVLEYVPNKRDSYISATDGSVITPLTPESPLYKNEAAMDAMISAGSVGGGKLSEAELENSGILESLISKENGEKLLRDNKLLSVSSDMELSGFNTSYDSKAKKYYYNYNFSCENQSASATIDAQDGNIRGYSYHNGKYEEVAEEHTALAKGYVQKLAPMHYKADDSLSYKFSE